MKNNLLIRFISILIFSILYFVSCTSDKQTINPSTNNTICDTSFAFNTRINVILESQCYGCHGSSDINFPLKPFSKLQTAALATNSIFLKSIKHQAGASAMPKNSPKLSDCDITAIEKWIKNGALNN